MIKHTIDIIIPKYIFPLLPAYLKLKFSYGVFINVSNVSRFYVTNWYREII